MTRSIVQGSAVLAVLACLAVAYSCATQRRAGMADPGPATETSDPASMPRAYSAHEAVFEKDKYPSATVCATCHPKHFDEWSVSQHAYADISPIFNAMAATINRRSNGSFGDFCIRCHTPIGMELGEPPFTSQLDRSEVAYEGVTCIACHRVDQPFGKVSARRAITEGDILVPVVGPTGGAEVKRVIEDPEFKVVTEPGVQGRAIHTDAKKFFQLVESGFCAACHDVTLPNGFRLEEAFSEYKISPAARKGISCQDCHMGEKPGEPNSYAEGPAAEVGGMPTKVRRITNHMWVGPDYSIVHPALFPHNPKVRELASLREWLSFDYESGWGTDAFESKVPPGYKFPERWSTADDRYDGRMVLERQFRLLKEAGRQRLELLRRGYLIGEIVTDSASDEDGIAFRVQVKNGTEGHNAPTGFTEERVVYLEVIVRDAAGSVIFQSGNMDPNGDLRDRHSFYVHDGELPLDTQLFTLQSKFMNPMIRGGDREQILAVNYSVDALPFLRPETSSSVLQGRPQGARVHKFNIEPLGDRWARYKIDADALTGNGPYRATIKLISGMVPVNLVHEIKEAGFDYGMTPRQVADALVAGYRTLWERDVTFEISQD